MASFKSGDLVQLKSGGPVMTVEKYLRDSMGRTDAYRCQWFWREAQFGRI